MVGIEEALDDGASDLIFLLGRTVGSTTGSIDKDGMVVID